MKIVTVVGLFALVLACGIQNAVAASVNIVAIGSSWTYGSGNDDSGAFNGVPRSLAYPRLLEKLLRAKGIDAHVTNAGVRGNKASDVYARLNSDVPDGTQLVIVELAGRGIDPSNTPELEAKIVAALTARGIKGVGLDKYGTNGSTPMKDSPDLIDGFPGGHPNIRGQEVLAAHVLPKVLSALRQKGPVMIP